MGHVVGYVKCGWNFVPDPRIEVVGGSSRTLGVPYRVTPHFKDKQRGCGRVSWRGYTSGNKTKLFFFFQNNLSNTFRLRS